MDWLGELAGDWRAGELPELFDELDDAPDDFEGELDELDDEFDDELDEPEVVPDEVDAPDELVPDDEVLPDDVPEFLTAAWVAPGRTTSTAPATATLAKDAVTVAAVSRRLPCSRSATARASCRAPA